MKRENWVRLLTPDPMHCPDCNERMVWEVRPDQAEYKGKTCTIDQEGWWCICGEGILNGEALMKWSAEFLAFMAKVEEDERR